MDKYQEADIWLAEQMGECVEHDYIDKAGTRKDLCAGEIQWRDNVCRKCGAHASKWKVTPRSQDLGAMVNVADKLDVMLIVSLKPGCKWVHVDIYSGSGMKSKRNMDIMEYYKDHKSPQHAAAWAIYLALRKVKR